MENFEKVTLNDFLVGGNVENKLLKITENISSPKYFFKEGFEFNDYIQHKINGMNKEELIYIMESVSKDGIEKAMMVLDHSNDKLLKDIQQSRGNVKNMHYYDIIERMLNDLSLTCAHNQEVMKAKEIIFELEKNKQVFVKAYAQDNMYKKTVYVSSIMAAVYTIIKEHLMYTDMTSSKNEGKFVMMQHNTHDVVDKDNLRNLNNNLALIIKKGVNPHAKNSGPRGLTEDASIYDLVANKISRMKPLKEDFSLDSVGTAAGTAAGTAIGKELKGKGPEISNSFGAGWLFDYDRMKEKYLYEPASANGKELTPETKSLIWKYFKDKNGMTAEEKAKLASVIGDNGMARIDNISNDGVVNAGFVTLEYLIKAINIPFAAAKKVGQIYDDIGESISKMNWSSTTEHGMVFGAALAALLFIKNFGAITKSMIMYLDSYEYIREAAKKGNSRSDRATALILDKVHGLKKFLLRIWKDDKSKNIQDYMKDLNGSIAVINKYEPTTAYASPAPQGYENKSKHDGLNFSSIGYANTASYKPSLVKPLPQNNQSNNHNNNSFF